MRDEWSDRRIEAYRDLGYSPERIANLIANKYRITWGTHAHVYIEQRSETVPRQSQRINADTAPGQKRP